MRILPSDGLHQRSDAGEPRDGGVPDGLRKLSRHRPVVRWHIQPCQHRIPADGCAHGAAARMQRLSREWQLLTEQHALLLVPSEGIRGDE